MSTKHKPAIALPWRLAMSGYSLKSDAGIVASVPRCGNAGNKEISAFVEDADFAAHAANAYPRLVEALLHYATDDGGGQKARDLLIELGESL